MRRRGALEGVHAEGRAEALEEDELERRRRREAGPDGEEAAVEAARPVLLDSFTCEKCRFLVGPTGIEPVIFAL